MDGEIQLTYSRSDENTCPYTFIWVMTGENQVIDDMDHLRVDQLL